MSFFLILQSHLKDIQSAFVSILSDSDGKYSCCILKSCVFFWAFSRLQGIFQQTESQLHCCQH